MNYIKGNDRIQTVLFNLDDEISQDNPVRLIDLLVDKLIAINPARYHWKGLSHTGRPAYSPSQMLKLYLYGYTNRIPSSRRLERECHRNIELKWLLHNLAPDFKTIADFRKDNQGIIHEMAISFRIMLKQGGLIDGELMALDGTKLKANAGSRELSYEDIVKQSGELDTEIRKYMHLLQCNDLQDDLHELDDSKLTTVEAIANRIKELREKQELLKEYQQISEHDNKRKVNPTDPDSRLIKSHKESFSGYNIQVVVDSVHKLIASAQVRQTGNDLREMEPALDNLKSELDIEPEVLLADQGYNNPLVLQKLEKERSTEVYVMVGDNKSAISNLVKGDFTYDADKNCYICPQGMILKQRGGIQKRKNRQAVVYQCQTKTCQDCPLRSSCTKGKEGRTITRYTDETWVEKYQEKMNSVPVKSLLKQRKGLIEHIFGVLKCWMGKIPLLVRGKQKVQTEINLYTTAYNMKRLVKLFGFDRIKEMIMSLAPEIENNVILLVRFMDQKLKYDEITENQRSILCYEK